MSKQIQKELVVFDLGETLISYEGISLNWSDNYHHAIDSALLMFELTPAQAEMEDAIAILNFYNSRINPRNFEVFESEVLYKVARTFKVDEEKFEHGFFAYFQRKSIVEDTALKTLVTLKNSGLSTAVLSDVAYGMPKQLILNDLVDLYSHIDAVLTSSEVGYRKPHPAGLEILMKQFNCPAHKVCYVGNEEKDIGCANAAGIQSLLLTKDDSIDYGQSSSIEKLIEILELI